MRAHKLYEDVLDDIDEIKPDVPEEEAEKFEIKPGFDHNIIYPIAEHWSSPRIVLVGDMCMERAPDVRDGVQRVHRGLLER